MIKWDDPGEWKHDKSPAQILMTINNICMNNLSACEAVYEYICKQCKKGDIDEAKLCGDILSNDIYDTLFTDITYFDSERYAKIIDNDNIKGKISYNKSYFYDSLNRDKLQSLRDHCCFNALVTRIIHSRCHLSIDLFRNILVMLENQQFKSYTKYNLNKNKWSFHKILVNDVLEIFASYCSIVDLLAFSLLNRYWYHKILQVTFIKKCNTFKKFDLTDEQIDLWTNPYSTRWIFSNCKHLRISATKELLMETIDTPDEIPRIDAPNVQYLEAGFNFFNTYPKQLKSLTISCLDYTLDDKDYHSWSVYDDICTNPILFTCILFDDYYGVENIPSSKSILWQSSTMMNSIVADCIVKPECEWVCLQNCDFSVRTNYVTPDLNEDLTQFYPSTKLSILFSTSLSRYFDMLNLLSSGSLYYKYISDLSIVTQWYSIDDDLLPLLDFIAKNKNSKYSKSIKILFTIDSIVCKEYYKKHHERTCYIFAWCLKNFKRIVFDDSINQLTLGIINTGDDKSRAHVFNLKKCQSKSQIDSHEKLWHNILFTDTNVDFVDLWWSKFNAIEDSIPTEQ